MGTTPPPDVLVAQQSVRVAHKGGSVKLVRGHTTAHAASAIVRDHPDLWGPYPVDFPADADAAPLRPADGDSRPAWENYATELGLDAAAVAQLPGKRDVIDLADKVASGELEVRVDGQALPPAPAKSAARPAWNDYAVALGLNADLVAGLPSKGDVASLAARVASGELELDDAGYAPGLEPDQDDGTPDPATAGDDPADPDA